MSLALAQKLYNRRKYSDCVLALDSLLKKDHRNLELLRLRGYSAQHLGQSDAAISFLERALAVSNEPFREHYSLAVIYARIGNRLKTLEHGQKAYESNKDFLGSGTILGLELIQSGRVIEAEEVGRHLIKQFPREKIGYRVLGQALLNQGDAREGVEFLGKAVAMDPGDLELHSTLLLAVNSSERMSQREIYKQHRDWGRKAEQKYSKIEFSEKRKLGRIRLGYLSGDLGRHPVSIFLEPLLINHDREKFEVFCYSTSPKVDDVTKRLAGRVENWRNISSIYDKAQAAQAIAQDELDILVDLGGHTSTSIEILACKPARIQVTYLGYPNTTGLTSVDYRITDRLADPEVQDRFYTEALKRLPSGFLSFSAPDGTDEASAPPCEKNGYITFGSFNNPSKVTDVTVEAWSRILNAVPGSKLLVKYPCFQNETLKQRFTERFVKQGIDPVRIQVLGPVKERSNHLNTYDQVDIALDTFPYNGTTTTCEALWMGVPVISLYGQSHVSRVGLSLLTHCGMEPYTVGSVDEYVDRAQKLADAIEEQAKLRMGLRSILINSSVCDGAGTAEELEKAYCEMLDEKGVDIETTPVKSPVSDADYRKAMTLYNADEYTSAAEFCDRLLERHTTKLEILRIRGNCAQMLGNVHKALECHSKAAEISNSPHIDHFNLAIIYTSLGQRGEAVKQLYESYNSNKNFLDAGVNLVQELLCQCRVGEAGTLFEELKENFPNEKSVMALYPNLLVNKGFPCEAVELIKSFDTAEQMVLEKKLLMALNATPSVSQQEVFDYCRRWGARMEAKVTPYSHDSWQPPVDRKIRIGYVSNDFRSHSVAYFLEPLLYYCNRDRFEVVCYCCNAKQDHITKRFIELADQWHDISGTESNELRAKRIYDDRIDILVDLGGHFTEDIDIFAWKPAPVQVSYLGYPNTTGLSRIDYRITDPIADPADQNQFYTEELVRLPSGFLAYAPQFDSPDPAPSPCLEKGYITFGSFNSLSKYNNELVETWAAILDGVENAKLYIKNMWFKDASIIEEFKDRFENAGIARDRIVCQGPLLKPEDHLAAYGNIDIALDSFPYAGTTTTCEALWMGVPTVSLYGVSHVSRVGLSLLSQLGLTSFATGNKEEYIAKAINLAKNHQMLVQLRGALRKVLMNSSVCDAVTTTKELEAAYLTMLEQKQSERNGNG